jgi:hypothetical protein
MLHSFVLSASNEEEMSESLLPAQYLLHKKASGMVWTIRIRTDVLPFLQLNPTHVARSKSLYRLSCPSLLKSIRDTPHIYPSHAASDHDRALYRVHANKTAPFLSASPVFLQRHKSGFEIELFALSSK